MPREARLPVTVATATRNHLLASLDMPTRSAVVARAEYLRLTERTPVSDAGEPIAHVDFVLDGLVSIVAVSREGSTVEVGPVGCDGMVGLPVYLGGGTDPLEAFVQVAPVETVRLRTPDFQALLREHPGLRRVMGLYTQWTYFGMAQWVLCARLHPVEERMGRWLLMCHDRLGQDEFRLTHEYLGEMLGVRRASVTIAAGVLRKGGLIEYHRGVVTVLDRPRLEEAACECNRVTAHEYQRLFGRWPVMLDKRATAPATPSADGSVRGRPLRRTAGRRSARADA
jgi:CRP-like cAMP-binding protein